MAEYKYDEEGGQFLTFVLTFLLLVLVPLTYSLLASSTKPRAGRQGWFDAAGQKVAAIKRVNRRSITNPQISKRVLFVVVGWGVVAFLFQKIMNAAANSSHAVYDPFSILGIATGATEKEIKKHYKRLSVKFHPDKLVLGENQTKEEAEGQFIELTKAYKSLTDETIRKNFELYGHPDGRQEMSMGIALPRWVIESHNNIYVLGVYGLIFGVGLPYLVAKWWYGSRSKTKDGLNNATARTYFQHLREDTPVPRILALLAISEEFSDARLNRIGKDADEAALAQLEKDVREKVAELVPEWGLIEGFRTPSIRKALVLLYAHVLRIETPSVRLTKAKYTYAHKAVAQLNGLMTISLAHNWLNETLVLMDLIQRFVQAVPIHADPAVELVQLPGISIEAARKVVRAHPVAAQGIQGLWKVPDAERKRLLFANGVSQSEYEQVVKVMREWPRLELVDAYFKVTGEKLATTGSIVQFVVKIRTLPLRKDGSLLRNGTRADAKRTDEETSVRPGTEEDDDTSLDALIGRKDEKSDKEGKTPVGFARAPYFLEERKPTWYVMLGDHKLDRVIVQPTRVSDVGPDKLRTYTVQFQAPPQAGLYTFQAILKSDSFIGCDAQRSVKLKVDDPTALDDADEANEDEISDPEEDSLAGQMAVMRGQKVKPMRDQDDSSDSGSEEEDEDEDEDEDEKSESESDSDSD